MGKGAAIGGTIGMGVGALFGGVGAPIGAAIGSGIGGAIDAGQAQNTQSYLNTQHLFGGPRVRPEMLEGNETGMGSPEILTPNVGPDLLSYLQEMEPQQEIQPFSPDRADPPGQFTRSYRGHFGERTLDREGY